MKIAVLHNPTAGDREFSRRELIALLGDAGYDAKYFSIKDDAWRDRDRLRHMEFIAVAGGDGSVRKAALQLHGIGPPIALLPLGTANNVSTTLGITGSPEKIVKSWSRARTRKLDLGVAEGPWGEKTFVESVGFGLLGRMVGIMEAIAEAAEHRPALREDRVHRTSSVVLALAHELRPIRLRVSLDDGPARTENYLLLEVMNIDRVGPGWELAPGADPGDGRLDAVLATADKREKLKRSLLDNIAGEKSRRLLPRKKVRTLQVELTDGEFRLDDRLILDLRSPRAKSRRVTIKISVRPQALEILLPRFARR